MSNSRSKLTAFGRQLLVERIQSGWSLRRAAITLGISATWAWVLWHRFKSEGAAAFVLRSSRPHRSPRRTAPAIEARIARERRRRRWGPHRLSWQLHLARSTIYAVLRRLGLAHLKVFRPARPIFRRYERALPGDLLHVDTKKLGKLPPGGGKRFGPQHSRLGRIGWDYVHVAVDDRTRVPYVERLRAADGGSCAGFMARALAFFADHGVQVRQVMTDNAMAYRRSRAFAAVLQRGGVEHIRIPSYTPRWNGKAEAFIGILLREWSYARPLWRQPSPGDRPTCVRPFVHSPTTSRRARWADSDAATSSRCS